MGLASKVPPAARFYFRETKNIIMLSNTKLFFAALLLLTTIAVQAQVSVGARVGYQLNNVYTTEGLDALAPDFHNIDEVNVGLVVEIPVAGGFSFQPELAYTTKGFGLKEGFDAELLGVNLPVSGRAETRIRYVEAPLLAKYKFGQEALKAYVAAGPTLSYASSGQIDTYANVLLEVDLGSVPLNLDNINYERFDVGATVALGAQYDFGPVTTFVDARYYRGFSELYDIPFVNEKVRNTGYGFNFGVMVPLGN
jgi:hypothetical protein